MDMMISQVTENDIAALAELAAELWPGHSGDELTVEFSELMRRAGVAMFLAWDELTACGFAQCQLRRDYVEGTSTSPVGYLEGIYVRAPYRGRGIARSLLAACEAWAKEQGCTEFASDCELDNTGSLHFHLSVGFREANRIICFIKNL